MATASGVFSICYLFYFSTVLLTRLFVRLPRNSRSLALRVRLHVSSLGVKVFKWSFKILNSETIKFTITSSEKKIFERKIDGTSEGEIDVIGEEVVLRWENDGWIRPRRVRVEWFVGEDVDVGV